MAHDAYSLHILSERIRKYSEIISLLCGLGETSTSAQVDIIRHIPGPVDRVKHTIHVRPEVLRPVLEGVKARLEKELAELGFNVDGPTDADQTNERNS